MISNKLWADIPEKQRAIWRHDRSRKTPPTCEMAVWWEPWKKFYRCQRTTAPGADFCYIHGGPHMPHPSRVPLLERRLRRIAQRLSKEAQRLHEMKYQVQSMQHYVNTIEAEFSAAERELKHERKREAS